MEAGADLSVAVRVSCPGECDLRGGVVEVVSRDGDVVRGKLSEAQGEDSSCIADIFLKAPTEAGEAEWRFTFPEQEVAGNVHRESALIMAYEVIPHTTSIALWGVPSPVLGSSFTVKVGIKCSALCQLGGQRVEIHDDDGVRLGEGRLRDDPKPGTEGLYEGEVHLSAPENAGVCNASVSFRPEGSSLPHLGSVGDFTFRCLEPPEHTVAVRIIPQGIDTPLEDIEVRVGDYQTMTDSHGTAELEVASGSHELSVWRIDIEPVFIELKITEDTEIEVGVEPGRFVDEDDERMWM